MNTLKSSLLSCGLVLPGLVLLGAVRLDAAGLTPGERAVLELLGRECPVVHLWPDGKGPDEPKALGEETVGPTERAPGGTLISHVSDPSFVVISPPEASRTGAAIVLCPGGGYGSLGAHAVVETAQWMNARGVTVILLKYRVPKRDQGYAKYHHALQDAQRAMGILRARASRWHIDPAKIGIGGFSAGGHLAAMLSNHYQERTYTPIDDADRVSCRPDFAVLLYPAYLTDPISSRTCDPALHVDRMSKESTPPTFISITMPDKFTTGAVAYYLALRKAGVPAEIHVYPTDGHGGAIGKYPFGQWAEECYRWMGDRGLIARPEKSLPEVEDLPKGDYPVVQLWPGGKGPDETRPIGPESVRPAEKSNNVIRITNVTNPTVTVVTPPEEKNTGTAVVVCPGGGYNILAFNKEGTEIVRWLNSIGVTGVLLKYRVPRRNEGFEKHHHALQDAQRAMGIVRARAGEWGIHPDRIGILGFSAGGHLTAALSNNFQQRTYDPIDEYDKVSCRPDFVVPIYPAYLVDPIDSDHLDPLMKVDQMKRNLNPPAFISIAGDDRFTPGALCYYLELRRAEIPSELHVFASGGHGCGIRPDAYPASAWSQRCARWMKDTGLLDR